MTIQQKEKCMILYVKYNSVMYVQSEFQGCSTQDMKSCHCCQGTDMHCRVHDNHCSDFITLHSNASCSLYYLYYHTTPYQHLYDVSHF
jgi:hypothetical protein